MRFMKNKLLVLIILLSIFLRFIGLVPNLSNSDEGYIQDYSWRIVKNVITKADLNPHSFKYGSWSFYLQALSAFPVLGLSYLGETANTYLSSSFTSKPLSFALFFDEAVRKYGKTLVLFGRAQTAGFGVASIFIIYLIGSRLINKRVGLLSALFLSVAPLHVRDSHYITTDVLFVFFLLVAFLFAVRAYQDKKLKDFIWLGFFTGFASTIRLFPLTFIFYGLTIVLTFSKSWEWVKKVLLSLLFIILGFFVGLPYLFLDPNGFTLMMQDLEKYVLPWYSTSISNYAFSLFTSIISHGKSSLPDIKMLYSTPHSFRSVHASWIFFNAYGILPTIFAIFGMVILLFKSFRKFLLLFVTPILTFIYISAYIPATYERLSLPILPFLTIFTAIFIDYLFNRNSKGNKKLNLFYLFIIVLALVQPFMIASRASIACSQKSLQDQSSDWIRDNISESAKIGYVTMVSAPPKKYASWFALEPGYNLSLEEALKNGLDHAFISAGRLDYITFPFFNDFFIPPKNLYLNSYESLVLSEYQSRAKLLGVVEKPWMCDFSRIYYYQLPKELKIQNTLVRSYKFIDKNEVDLWKIKSFDKTGQANIGLKNNTLSYHQGSFSYSAPRIVSENISIQSGKTYSFSFKIKNSNKLTGSIPKVVARLDFYDDPPKTLSGKISKRLDVIHDSILLIRQGPTPVYFEKLSKRRRFFNDPDLPGRVVSLSTATKVNAGWQEISISSLAPNYSNYATLSIQPITPFELDLLIDDISFSSN